MILFNQSDVRLARHPIAAGLVRGWILSNYSERKETLFAESIDGRFFTTGEIAASVYFNEPGKRVWTACNTVPPHAEYIGQYLADMLPA